MAADRQVILAMDGQVTRAEAIRTVRGLLETLPEDSPYRRLSNQQIMECFPFEDRRLFIPESEVVPREDVAAVIDVLAIYAEDGRVITNLIDPFQDIQEDVRVLTSERIVRRTAEERADLMYLAEQTDPEYNRSVADYARLRPDGVNVSFGRAIRAIKARAPDWDGEDDIPDELGNCALCLEDKPVYALHLTNVGQETHSFICINCLIDHFNHQTDGPNIECFKRPECSLSLYEHMIYKTVIHAPEVERNALLGRLNGIVTMRRTNFQLRKNRSNIFDDESSADVYLEHFFRIQAVPHIDIDNVEIIRLELQRRGLILTAAQLLEKIVEYNNRPESRIRGILTELITEEDHEVTDEDLEIVRESLGLIGIDTTVEQLHATLTLIDRQKAEEFGIEVAAVIASRQAEYARKREVVEKRRAEGDAARARRADEQRQARIIGEIQRLRAAGQKVAIDWAINGDDFPVIINDGMSKHEYTLCPYCFRKERHESGCIFFDHQQYDRHLQRAVHIPCPTGPVDSIHPWRHHQEWCYLCGRPTIGHEHYNLFDARIATGQHIPGLDRYGFNDSVGECLVNGGGARIEFFVRLLAIRDQVLEDFNRDLYVFNMEMKQRIYARTMSVPYLGQVQRWINAGGYSLVENDLYGPNVRRAIVIYNRVARDRAASREVSVNIILDPPQLRPDWIPESPEHRFVGGSHSKTVRRQTYKKRSKNKRSRRSKSSQN